MILAYIGNEADQAEVVQTLLEEARRGEISVATSVLSIAEVSFGAHERDHGLTEEGEAAIEELWSPASPIRLIDVTPALLRGTRTLIRKARSSGHAIQGADGMHSLWASSGLSFSACLCAAAASSCIAVIELGIVDPQEHGPAPLASTRTPAARPIDDGLRGSLDESVVCLQ